MKRYFNSNKNWSYFVGGLFVLWGLTPVANAMIKNSLVVHNSRTETITVSVNNSQGRYVGTFYIDAKSTKSIRVEDTEEGSDYFEAYDMSGSLLKTGIASGIYSNFDWWVD